MATIKTDKVLNGKLMSSTLVFFTEGNILKKKNDINFVKLRHPSSDQPAMFIIGPDNDKVYEILSLNESKRSWFIDDNVKCDGKILIATLIDPIFLVLPYLKKMSRVKPLEQCLEDEHFPEIRRLAYCRNLKLSLVGDRKGDESFQAYKYNEEKTLNWLHKKIKKIIEVIKEKNINVTQATVSANYVNSKHKSENEMEYLEYAHGLISEYIDDELKKKLALHLNLSEEKKKRKLDDSIDRDQEKKIKTEEINKNINSSFEEKFISKTPNQEKVKNVISKKDIARQKAASGSKSITSFFKKVN